MMEQDEPLIEHDDQSFWENFDATNDRRRGLDWATFSDNDIVGGGTSTEENVSDDTIEKKENLTLVTDWKVEQDDKLHSIFSHRRSGIAEAPNLDDNENDANAADTRRGRRKGRSNDATSNTKARSRSSGISASMMGERRRRMQSQDRDKRGEKPPSLRRTQTSSSNRSSTIRDGSSRTLGLRRTQTSATPRAPSMRGLIAMDNSTPDARFQYKLTTSLVDDSINLDERRRYRRRLGRVGSSQGLGNSSSDGHTISNSSSRRNRSLRSSSTTRIDSSSRRGTLRSRKIVRVNSNESGSIKGSDRRRGKRGDKSSLMTLEDLGEEGKKNLGGCDNSFHTSSNSSAGTSNSSSSRPKRLPYKTRPNESSGSIESSGRTQPSKERSTFKKTESSSSTKGVAKVFPSLPESSKGVQTSANLQRMHDLAGRCQKARQRAQKVEGKATLRLKQGGDSELSLEEVFAAPPSTKSTHHLNSLHMPCNNIKLGNENSSDMSGLTIESGVSFESGHECSQSVVSSASDSSDETVTKRIQELRKNWKTSINQLPVIPNTTAPSRERKTVTSLGA